MRWSQKVGGTDVHLSLFRSFGIITGVYELTRRTSGERTWHTDNVGGQLRQRSTLSERNESPGCLAQTGRVMRLTRAVHPPAIAQPTRCASQCKLPEVQNFDWSTTWVLSDGQDISAKQDREVGKDYDLPGYARVIKAGLRLEADSRLRRPRGEGHGGDADCAGCGCCQANLILSAQPPRRPRLMIM
jgi:hypothetical protein